MTAFQFKLCIALLLTLSMMSLQPYTFGQTEKKVEIIGDTIKNSDIFFIGEVHFNKEANAFACSMVQFVNERYGINNIVIEYGKSLAWLCNQYLQKGDTTVFLYVQRPFRESLLNYKLKNQSLHPDKQLTIYGIDFERMVFIKALKMIFDKHPDAISTELYQYVFSFSDSIARLNVLEPSQIKLRKVIYGKARKLFYKERLRQKNILKTDYVVVESFLTNPATEKRFGHRDHTMCINLIDQLNGRKFICVGGLDHMETSRYWSMVRRYERKTKNKFTIMPEVCKLKSTNEFVAPKCLIKSDSTLSIAYVQYRQPGKFTVVNHEQLKPYVHSRSYGHNTYYTFFEQDAADY